MHLDFANLLNLVSTIIFAADTTGGTNPKSLTH